MKKILDTRKMDALQTRELNKIALNERKNFIEQIDKLNEKHGDDIWWWITCFASKCNQDYVYETICLFIYVVNRVTIDKVSIVVTDNYMLYKLIKLNGISSAKYLGKKQRDWKWIAYPLFWFRKVQKWINIMRGQTKKISMFSPDTTFVETYLLSSSFEESTYNDRYYTGLVDNLVNNEKVCFVVSSLIINDQKKYSELVKRLDSRIEKYQFIFKERYLSLVDYIELFVFPLKCYAWSLRKFYYGKWDFTPLMRKSILCNSASENSMEGYLSFKFAKRIRKAGGNITKYHMWYEGQPINNGIILGLRKNFPACKISGDIGLPLYEIKMNFYTSKYEKKIGVAPDYISLIGKAYVKDYQSICPTQVTYIAPAFRFKRIYDSLPECPRNGVIIVLSYFIEEAKRLLEVALSALETFDGKIYIKNHPVNRQLNLDDYDITTRLNVQFVDGDIRDILPLCCLAIASATTSGTEILAAGCKLIMYMPIGRVSNTCIPLCVPADIYALAYGKEETKYSVKRLMMTGEGDFDYSICFEPVNCENVNRYINFGGDVRS